VRRLHSARLKARDLDLDPLGTAVGIDEQLR